MKLSKVWLFAMGLAAVLAMSFAIGCGDDDDDDDDSSDDAAADDATDDTDDDAVDALMDQAYSACMQYWEACELETADEFCTDWVESYRPAMEEYADVMDSDCMMTVMNDFFTCLGGDCDPTGAWVTCNEQVQNQMLACFE